VSKDGQRGLRRLHPAGAVAIEVRWTGPDRFSVAVDGGRAVRWDVTPVAHGDPRDERDGARDAGTLVAHAGAPA
jgi:hypothetical protein